MTEQGIAALSAGTRLGKYTIVRLIGAGAMGAVYEATHDEIGKPVAIKVLSPHLASVPEARARFLLEAQLTSRVRHPHIVDVTDVGTERGRTFLVMELLSGEDLAQRLQRSGPIPADEMADIMLPVCDAITAAHRNGVTHRDLKPHNVFLAEHDHRVHPMVLDFGISIAKRRHPSGAHERGATAASSAVVGSPYYLAPEQVADSRAAGPASDQYALGVILYECLTGQLPFEGGNLRDVLQAISASNPRSPNERRPGLPLGLGEVVLKAMAHDPQARFGSVKDLGRALLPFATTRARLFWEESFAEDRGLTPGPKRRAPASPAIAAEAATPSPYVRTLSPDVSDGTEPSEPIEQIPLGQSGQVETRETTDQSFMFADRAFADRTFAARTFAERLTTALRAKWVFAAGAMALAIGGTLLATRGGSTAPRRVTEGPTPALAAEQTLTAQPTPAAPPIPATPPTPPTPTAPATPAAPPTPAAVPTQEPVPPLEPAPSSPKTASPSKAATAEVAPVPEPAKPAPASNAASPVQARDRTDKAPAHGDPGVRAKRKVPILD